MIIKFYDLKKNLNEKINFFLLYGNNIGLIEEIIETTLKPAFSKNISYYEEEKVLNNFDNFKEEILNKSFFEDNKLIIINRVTNKILDIIEELIDKDIQDVKIIFITKNLEKKSKLRNFFEKNNKTIISAFYEDNNQTLVMIAKKFFQERNIKISTQNINIIVERAKGNRINLKNELEKISSFSENKETITASDIIQLTNLAENYNISELVDQCLAKNKKKTMNILNENNSSIEDNIQILKTFLYKLKRLKNLKKEIEIKKNQELVLSAHKPPIFWKDKDIIKLQLKIWSSEELQKSIQEINDIELLVKKNSQVSNYITNNFILEKLENSNNKT